jgi:hypothetical protein
VNSPYLMETEFVSEIFQMLFAVSILRPSLTWTTGTEMTNSLGRLVFASPTADMRGIRVEIQATMNPLTSFNPAAAKK